MAETPPPVSGLSLRELILELRADVRSIDIKLENKADRTRVHDLANQINVIRLERAAERAEQVQLVGDVREAQADIRSLGTWRYLVTGGLIVAGSTSGALLAQTLGFF